MKEIADSITTMITWEYDVPSNYASKELPVLDIKVRIDTEDKYNPIKFRFYEKINVNYKSLKYDYIYQKSNLL